MRVLHCIYDDPDNPWVGGGGAVRVRELYRRLVPRVEVTFATGSYPGAVEGTRDGVRYLRLGAPAPYLWSRLSYAMAATRLLERATYDVAVVDYSPYAPVFVPMGRPVAITVHHLAGATPRARWGSAASAALRLLERTAIGRARWLSATSAATFAALQPLVRSDAHIARVAAGVPDELFELRREERDFLLYLGRLDLFHKGLDVLLEAFALVARGRPAAKLLLAGRGRDGARVVARARELGLDQRVRVLGAVTESERRALLSGALAQLMPSRFEGFGMAAAEAMAAGVPVIAAAVDSLPEVVGEGGLLVAPNDPAALASATMALLDDPAARARLSVAARAWTERFRWRAVAEDHRAFLERVAASGPERSRAG